MHVCIYIYLYVLYIICIYGWLEYWNITFRALIIYNNYRYLFLELINDSERDENIEAWSKVPKIPLKVTSFSLK